jgi:hypothetical protein
MPMTCQEKNSLAYFDGALRTKKKVYKTLATMISFLLSLVLLRNENFQTRQHHTNELLLGNKHSSLLRWTTNDIEKRY